MSALDTRTQETPSVKAGLWLRVNPKEGCEGKCEDPYLLPFFSDSKEYDPISRRLRVCVCVCVCVHANARAHACVCTCRGTLPDTCGPFQPLDLHPVPLPQIPAL